VSTFFPSAGLADGNNYTFRSFNPRPPGRGLGADYAVEREP